MATKYACDMSFIASLGTIIYSKLFLDYHQIKISRSYTSTNNENLIDGDYSKFKNYFQFAKFAFIKKDISWVSLNNVPVPSLNKHNILLLHNVFYLYSLQELFKCREVIPFKFYFKYFYVRFALKYFNIKEVYVQTKFMRRRLKKLYKGNINVLSKDLYFEFLEGKVGQSLCSVEGIDILIIGGSEKHKEVKPLLEKMAKLNVKGKVLNIYFIGTFEEAFIEKINSFGSFNFCCLNQLSHLDYLSYLNSARCCIIPSRHESLNLGLLECQYFKKEFFVRKADYSQELATDEHIYSNMEELIMKLNNKLENVQATI
ncbi:glycosyltransferase family 4 protein [Thalassomonas sp. M1454]|uniref:glycosyltransferase family 4 protein n=1 Tax=Thalassomonas sp. M1454 TaxID=2594477 RepID=UPI00117FFA3A|nr:glycosyltransferase family 4 protein [Thalassomonas sp. M1454]TRX57193.1 glycosyltransferase family 4 protein [Thalassomonas sp. M1454]